MRYIDRNTDLPNLDVPEEITAILEGSIYNRQIFDSENSGDQNPNYVTKSLKYTSTDKERPNFRRLEDLPEEYQNETNERILNILGFDETLEFQLESWRLLRGQLVRTRLENRHQGMVISAPTGFGKTASFLGPIINTILGDDQRRNSAILVYPRKALLHNQLERLLEIIYNMNEADYAEVPSVGIWEGGQPYKSDQLFSEENSIVNFDGYETTLSIAGDFRENINASELVVEEVAQGYRIRGQDGEVLFNHRDLCLNRKRVLDNEPNILLTTLESLENIGAKPHYDLADRADYVVFDEIHQYTGIRGAHAHRVIKNLKAEQESPSVFVGASATVEKPEVFGRKLFGFHSTDPESDEGSEEGDLVEPLLPANEPADLVSIQPSPEDFAQDVYDQQHFYFMLTPDDGPSVASQYIQQAMFVGHSLLRDANSPNEETKVLSFIDSISQIHNLRRKFRNADHHRGLWRNHQHLSEGGWQDIAERTGHEFIEEALGEPLPIYSDSDRTIEEIPTHRIVHATNFLELGIDVSDLKYVINYRPPRNMASFKQRVGRAGRGMGTDAHMFVLLSSMAGDTNFYYRAERFFESDITTPLRIDNHVIDWIHDQFYQYYENLESFRKMHPSDWFQENRMGDVLRNFFKDTMGWDEFYTFLTEPSDTFRLLLGESPKVNNLLTGSIRPARVTLNELEESVRDELDEIDEIINIDADGVLLGDEEALRLADELYQDVQQELELTIKILEENDEETGGLPEIADSVQTRERSTAEEELSILESLVDKFLMEFVDIRSAVPRSIEIELPDLTVIEDIRDSVTRAQEFHQENDLGELGAQRKKIYYLQHSVDQIERFNRINVPHGSLYAVKHLFRAAYYFSRSLEVYAERNPTSSVSEEGLGTVWYVPPDYFENAGLFFRLVSPSGNESDESIELLLTQYVPFRQEYSEQEGRLEVFQPSIVKDDQNNNRLDFSDVPGREKADVKIPDRIELKSVRDLSGDRSQAIVPYDPRSFEILSEEERRNRSEENIDVGRVYSEAEINTEAELEEEATEGQLRLGDTEAKAWIEAIHLTITPAYQIGNNYFLNYDHEYSPEPIQRRGQKLGYSLDTRAIQWCLSNFVEKIDEELVNDVNRYKDLDEERSSEFIALTTAAHFLTILIADVTATNPDLLLYSVDEESSSITVFEQTEGGQGIVDMFLEEVRRTPETVLESVLRLTRNPQIHNERLWAAEIEEDDMPCWSLLYERVYSNYYGSRELSRNDATMEINKIVETTFGYEHPGSSERITNEVLTTLDRIHRVSNEHQLSPEKLHELKAATAIERVEGTDPEDIYGELIDDYSDILDEIPHGTYSDLFISPDIDGCRANLTLPRKLMEYDQHEVLSDVLLRKLEEEIVSVKSADESVDFLIEEGRYSAFETEDQAIYLSFGRLPND